MPENKKQSPLSKSIAQYVVKNGTLHSHLDIAPHDESYYQWIKELSDERKLIVNYHGGNPIRYDKNSALEITVEPTKDSQIGYYTLEMGLSGSLDSFSLLLGPSHRIIIHDLKNHRVIETTRSGAQKSFSLDGLYSKIRYDFFEEAIKSKVSASLEMNYK